MATITKLQYSSGYVYASDGTNWWRRQTLADTWHVTTAPVTSTRQSGTRFPYQTGAAPTQKPMWAFRWDSYFNIGIGSNAKFSGPASSDEMTASLMSSSPTMYSPATDWNYPIYTATASDPLYYSPPGLTNYWWNQNHDWSIRINAAATPSQESFGGFEDRCLLLSDTSNPTVFAVYNNQAIIQRNAPITVNGVNYAGQVYTGVAATGVQGQGFNALFDTSSDGRPTYSQGNEFPPVQGADFDQGFINRCLPCSMLGSMMKPWATSSLEGWGTNHYNCVWPAVGSDYGGGGGYGGTIPFGSIIFIPKAVLDMTNWSFGGINPLGLTRGGMMIAKQMQNYGWTNVNTTGGPMHLYTSWDVQSTSARQTTFNEVQSALTTLHQYQRVMLSWMSYQPALTYPGGGTSINLNAAPGPGYQYDPRVNPNAPVNGGGTYPPKAPYWDPSLPPVFTNQNTY